MAKEVITYGKDVMKQAVSIHNIGRHHASE